MSLRLEMLQVARLAPKLLGESGELVHKFLLSQQNADGGFKDRSGKSDLYYTVFGAEGLIALQRPFDSAKLRNYLEGFQRGNNLDFIHLCCLVRCWAGLNEKPPAASEILSRIESHRTPDGGYSIMPDAKAGTAYAAFLAVGAYQDSGTQVPDALRLVQSLKFLETPDGAWANERGVKEGSTNPTAAMVNLLHNLRMPVNDRVGDWLLARAHPDGGFTANAVAPMPDLLSTATCLHALSALERSIEQLKEDCLDFIDTLWTSEGGFYGHWGDITLDCEYTYYGLLALGHLSL
jgi:prenyltransferase beta subunit